MTRIAAAAVGTADGVRMLSRATMPRTTAAPTAALPKTQRRAGATAMSSGISSLADLDRPFHVRVDHTPERICAGLREGQLVAEDHRWERNEESRVVESLAVPLTRV